MQRREEEHLYVYMVPPIDVWSGWRSARKVMKGLVSEYTADMQVFMDRLEAARNRVEAAGFDGRPVGWMVSSIPASGGDNHCEALLAIKQENSGWTFIVSPYALPWLDSVNELREQP